MNDGSFPYPGIMEDGKSPCCYKLKRDKPIEREVQSEATRRIVLHENRLIKYTHVANVPQPVQYLFGLPKTCMLEEGNYLLRYGVNAPHSFLDCLDACMAMLSSKLLTALKSMPMVDLIVAKTTQHFNTYNNGNLIQQFKTIENFKKVLESKKMDYTYLWEIVSDIFNTNLVVLRILGDTLDIVCPTNYYSSATFDVRKTILVLLEHEGGFEPVIEHNKIKLTHSIFHSYHNKFLHKTFVKLKDIYTRCVPSGNVNLTASAMYDILKPHVSDILQITNGPKCIGLSVNNFFIPCHPSAILPIKIISQIPVHDYDKTLQHLLAMSVYVPCKPVYKVVEEGKLTGILTQTNAFVACTPMDDIDTELSAYNKHVLYEYTPLPDSLDGDRISYTSRSNVENYVYAHLKKILKDKIAANLPLRTKINHAIKKKKVNEELVASVLADSIIVIDRHDDDFITEQMECKGECLANGKLVIPRINLVSGKPNHYFSKLANELNHHIRLSTFITKPQWNIPAVSFSVNENELLLIGSTIDSYFAELLEPKRLPDYYTTYDNANPKIRWSVVFKAIKLKKIIIKI